MSSPLRVPIPDKLRERAEADAARRGLNLRAWATETLEAHLAGCACDHAGRPADPAAEPSDPRESRVGALPGCPLSSAPEPLDGVRTPSPAVVPSCGACGAPLGKDGAPPKPGQKACSGRCRARLHREARQGRDAVARWLLKQAAEAVEAAQRALDWGRA